MMLQVEVVQGNKDRNIHTKAFKIKIESENFSSVFSANFKYLTSHPSNFFFLKCVTFHHTTITTIFSSIMFIVDFRAK